MANADHAGHSKTQLHTHTHTQTRPSPLASFIKATFSYAHHQSKSKLSLDALYMLKKKKKCLHLIKKLNRWVKADYVCVRN